MARQDVDGPQKDCSGEAIFAVQTGTTKKTGVLNYVLVASSTNAGLTHWLVGYAEGKVGSSLDRVDLRQRKLARDEIDDSDHLGLGAVAAGSALGGLDQRIGALEKPVADPTVLPTVRTANTHTTCKYLERSHLTRLRLGPSNSVAELVG